MNVFPDPNNPNRPLMEADGFIKYGSIFIDQRLKTAGPNTDYMTDFNTWLAVQNGVNTSGTDQFDQTRRFIRNMRDLTSDLHFDALYEAY